MSRITLALLTLAMALVVAAPVMAAEGAAKTTISAIDRGEAADEVRLEGAALEPLDDSAYVFSDGTGAISIRLAADASEEELPLFKLVSVEGIVGEDGVTVSSWELVPIFTPAVIVEEPQVIDAFWNWIIAFDSQAPAE
jgi:uncharacterized protein YdeI (BOF family)